MDNDDLPIGRVLDRREALRLLAMTGAAVLVGCDRGDAATSDSMSSLSRTSPAGGEAARTAALPGCVVRPELTEGPYFVDVQLDRSDIRTDPATGTAKSGVPLVLAFNVSEVRAGQCAPLQGAMVDVWHCDAEGIYSGVTDRGVGFDTVGQKFLRGHQITDSKGVARFTTIYPGWYPGRAVHIHFKIRAGAARQYDFTSQVFFDDKLSEKIFAKPPYRTEGRGRLTNASDGIYRRAGDTLLVKLTEENAGYTGAFDIGLDLST